MCWGRVAYWSIRPRVQCHCGGDDLWSRRGPGFKPAYGQNGSQLSDAHSLIRICWFVIVN
jgi:hypothetical protein